MTRDYCTKLMNYVNRLGARAACKKYGRNNIMRALAYLRTELNAHKTGATKCVS